MWPINLSTILGQDTYLWKLKDSDWLLAAIDGSMDDAHGMTFCKDLIMDDSDWKMRSIFCSERFPRLQSNAVKTEAGVG